MINKLKELYKECFNDSKSYMDFFFKEKYSKSNTPYIMKNNLIISMLFIVPKKIFLRNITLICPYIVGACTRKEYRNTGLITSLFYNCFHLLYKREITTIALYPLNHNFYRKYGFVTLNRMTKRKINYKIDNNLKLINENNLTELRKYCLRLRKK